MTTHTIGSWAVASAVAGVLAIAGCGQPPDQFIIVQNQVPTAGCVIPTTRGSLYRATGTLDVSLVLAPELFQPALFVVDEKTKHLPHGTHLRSEQPRPGARHGCVRHVSGGVRAGLGPCSRAAFQ